MFFELNGKTYGVKFSRAGTTTFANLFVVGESGELLPTNIEGTAVLYYKDKFEKSKGRKIALADLLLQIQTPIEDAEFIPEGLTKEDREKIWKKYFEKHKK